MSDKKKPISTGKKFFSDPIDQVAVVVTALNDQDQRIEFLSNPEAFGKKKGIRFDPKFVKAIKSETEKINTKLLEVGRGTSITPSSINDIRIKPSSVTGLDLDEPYVVAALPAVAAVAAAVSAVAAVVTAATAVYQATKW
jgi:hypothetical protein